MKNNQAGPCYKMIYVILAMAMMCAVLTACGGGEVSSNDSESKNGFERVEVHFGYSYGYQNAVMYMPEVFDASVDDKRFDEVGEVVKAYHYNLPYGDVVETNNTHDVYVLFMRINVVDDAESACAAIGEPNAAACVQYNMKSDGTYCDIYIEEQFRTSIWGHEIWHCLTGDFH